MTDDENVRCIKYEAINPKDRKSIIKDAEGNVKV